MRLPDPLYVEVKRSCARHARWHEARLPGNASRAGPGTEFPGLKALDEPGSGEQFLDYHRGMLTGFFETAASGSNARWALDRWEHFPSWLADYFAWAQPGFLRGAFDRAEEIVHSGTADDLGNFLESTLVSDDPFRGIHNLAHAHIAAYEEHRFGADHPFLRDAGMGSPETSPHNEHFWSLHAWIDALYSRLLMRRSVASESGAARAVRRSFPR